MSASGRPRALDEQKLKTVCSLVAAGVSLRQAAHFVDCDPKSIRREAERDHDFRAQLAKAKSEANIHPLQTLHQAAKANWRAALSWMERIDPDRFARPHAAIVTKREANQFVADLIDAIERAVASPQERENLFDLLTPAMPAAMRRRWNGPAMRRAAGRATQVFENRQAETERRELTEKSERDLRRRNLWHEIAQWLPAELCQKFAHNEDLFDPEEVFAQPPGPGPLVSDAQKTYKPGSLGAQAYNPAIHDRPNIASSQRPAKITVNERPTTNN